MSEDLFASQVSCSGIRKRSSKTLYGKYKEDSQSQFIKFANVVQNSLKNPINLCKPEFNKCINFYESELNNWRSKLQEDGIKDHYCEQKISDLLWTIQRRSCRAGKAVIREHSYSQSPILNKMNMTTNKNKVLFANNSMTGMSEFGSFDFNYLTNQNFNNDSGDSGIALVGRHKTRDNSNDMLEFEHSHASTLYGGYNNNLSLAFAQNELTETTQLSKEASNIRSRREKRGLLKDLTNIELTEYRKSSRNVQQKVKTVQNKRRYPYSLRSEVNFIDLTLNSDTDNTLDITDIDVTLVDEDLNTKADMSKWNDTSFAESDQDLTDPEYTKSNSPDSVSSSETVKYVGKPKPRKSVVTKRKNEATSSINATKQCRRTKKANNDKKIVTKQTRFNKTCTESIKLGRSSGKSTKTYINKKKAVVNETTMSCDLFATSTTSSKPTESSNNNEINASQQGWNRNGAIFNRFTGSVPRAMPKTSIETPINDRKITTKQDVVNVNGFSSDLFYGNTESGTSSLNKSTEARNLDENITEEQVVANESTSRGTASETELLEREKIDQINQKLIDLMGKEDMDDDEYNEVIKSVHEVAGKYNSLLSEKFLKLEQTKIQQANTLKTDKDLINPFAYVGPPNPHDNKKLQHVNLLEDNLGRAMEVGVLENRKCNDEPVDVDADECDRFLMVSLINDLSDELPVIYSGSKSPEDLDTKDLTWEKIMDEMMQEK